VPAGGPATAGTVSYPLTMPGASGTATGEAPRYSLVVSLAPATGDGTAANADSPSDSPHGGYGATTDACASCHSSHSASGPALLVRASPQSGLCLTCHREGGSASDTDVQAQYADPTVPQNDPSTRTYYRHDALATGSGHTSAGDDEFGGKSNRHSECADCHSPHAADSTASVQTANGWTASGRLGQASGVSVTNSETAGDPPTYTLIGGASAPLTFEYQLCFKCHSGFTQQAPRFPGEDVSLIGPSRQPLDKAIELNPANLAYHPIEAAGKNQTARMTASLAGTAPGKLWVFETTSTVRCANCHGPSSFANPAVDAQIDLDRTLKARTAPYSATDFSLCYLCHAEAPFVDQSGNTRSDTNFRQHGYHVSGIAGGSSTVTDIDTDGAGGGNAICAECHFRIHSTTVRTGGQGAYQRLVNFAPNVTASGSTSAPVGLDAWDQNAKTCTLTCHGQGHDPKGY
jgi:predicted CXXCH cytochrome family protein